MIKSVFKYFDVNDEGQITCDSIIWALKASNVAVDEMELVDYFNKRKLKKINFEQFKTLILSQNFQEERIKNLVLNKLIMKEMIILFSISNLIKI